MPRAALPGRVRACRRDERGSVMLLTLGYALITIAVVLVCLNATSLYLAQKRVDAIADAAALAAADGFDLVLRDGVPRAVLHDGGVRAQAASIVDAHGRAARLVRAWTPDGVSARVTVSDTWHPVVFSVFVPAGVALESTATSRTAAR